MRTLSLFLLGALCLFACQSDTANSAKTPATTSTAAPAPESETPNLTTNQEIPATFSAQKASQAPTIDGFSIDDCWKAAIWYPLNQRWIGEAYTPEDFQGRYKLSWDEDHIYILAEIVDDTLIDIHPDGLKQYWDDDCLEVFIDEDRSKGNHQYSHNAFAYHIALDYQVTDIGPDSVFRYYTDHVVSRRTVQGKVSTWEVAMSVYDDQYQDDSDDNTPVKLSAGKNVGFALAYCDNDYSAERENFIGSVVVEGEDKNRGWIDAGVFGSLILEE